MPESAHIDPLVAFFDEAAANWDAKSPRPEATRQRLGELKTDMGLRAGQEVLEVGCGTGQVTDWLVQTVDPGGVTAVDLSPRMLERAKARTGRARYLVADICTQELGEGTFDIAFCMHVLPHLSDIDAALANLYRMLRPNGRLIVLHLAHWREINDLHDRIGGAVAGHYLPPPTVWEGLLARHGLVLTTLRDEADLLLVIAERR